MAIVMELSWRGFTPEQYDDARNRLGWEMPGLLSHVVWFDGGAVHVVDAWESAEACERCVQERVMPVLKGEMGVEGDPEVAVYPAHLAFSQ